MNPDDAEPKVRYPAVMMEPQRRAARPKPPATALLKEASFVPSWGRGFQMDSECGIAAGRHYG
eukprot:scaffold260639_cov36-Tisochrysis_lutea.AAC.3